MYLIIFFVCSIFLFKGIDNNFTQTSEEKVPSYPFTKDSVTFENDEKWHKIMNKQRKKKDLSSVEYHSSSSELTKNYGNINGHAESLTNNEDTIGPIIKNLFIWLGIPVIVIVFVCGVLRTCIEFCHKYLGLCREPVYANNIPQFESDFQRNRWISEAEIINMPQIERENLSKRNWDELAQTQIESQNSSWVFHPLMENVMTQFENGASSMIDPKIPIQKQADYLPYNAMWEFPENHLQLVEELGSGAFGLVFKGVAKGIVKKNIETVVAVKTVKNNSEFTQIKALASELKIMIHLGQHLNVINLLGACTKNMKKMELFIIVEFCQFGNLKDFLVKRKDSFTNLLDDSDSIIHIDQQLPSTYKKNIKKVSYDDAVDAGSIEISTNDLVCWSFQIARGMDFLNSRKIIHGDLAARNILLAENNIVKISDFGLSKSICNCNYIISRSEEMLPLKWMSIESIRDHKFSFKSDVWSFGVVLWEIFTLGQTPYPEKRINLAFINLLEEGYRMEKPKFCPKLIYDLMLDCWQAEPNQRPSFLDLENKIGSLLEEASREYYIDLNKPYMEFNIERMNDKNQEDYFSKFSSDLFFINRPDYGD